MFNAIFKSAGVIAWLLASLACSADRAAPASGEAASADLGRLTSALGVDGGVDAGDAGDGADAGDLADAAP